MDNQQNAPVLSPMLTPDGLLTPVWRRWFQNLKIRDDEIRRKPAKTYTSDQTLSSFDLGKAILFDIGIAEVTCTLPAVGTNDIWSWITIIRRGTGDFTIRCNDSDTLERGGSSLYCDESIRVAANVTLQLFTETQWAIIGATGIWKVQAV